MKKEGIHTRERTSMWRSEPEKGKEDITAKGWLGVGCQSLIRETRRGHPRSGDISTCRVRTRVQ